MIGGYIDGTGKFTYQVASKLAGTFIFGWVCRYADQQMSWQISVRVKPGEKHTQIEPVDWWKGNLRIFRTTGEKTGKYKWFVGMK